MKHDCTTHPGPICEERAASEKRAKYFDKPAPPAARPETTYEKFVREASPETLADLRREEAALAKTEARLAAASGEECDGHYHCWPDAGDVCVCGNVRRLSAPAPEGAVTPCERCGVSHLPSAHFASAIAALREDSTEVISGLRDALAAKDEEVRLLRLGNDDMRQSLTTINTEKDREREVALAEAKREIERLTRERDEQVEATYEWAKEAVAFVRDLLAILATEEGSTYYHGEIPLDRKDSLAYTGKGAEDFLARFEKAFTFKPKVLAADRKEKP